MSTKNNDTQTKLKEEGKVNPQQPAPGKEVPNSGFNDGQKPKFDRGDPAVNPAVAGAGAANADAADYPHKEGELPATDENIKTMSAEEYDSLPPQSAKRTGYIRDNTPNKTETF